MKRIRLIALFTLIVAVFGLVAGKARTYILRKVTSNSLPQAVQPISPVVLAHVPAGIPIALSNLSLRGADDGNKRPRVESLMFRAVALSGQSLTSLNFVAFEFDAKGTLRRAASFVSEHDGIRQGVVEITIPRSRTGRPIATASCWRCPATRASKTPRAPSSPRRSSNTTKLLIHCSPMASTP